MATTVSKWMNNPAPTLAPISAVLPAMHAPEFMVAGSPPPMPIAERARMLNLNNFSTAFHTIFNRPGTTSQGR